MKRLTDTDWGLLVFRLGYAALLFGLHGHARFFRAYNYAVHGEPWTFVTIVGNLGFPAPAVFAVLSALSESIGSLLIGLGVYTRVCAAIIGFNMLIAFYNEAHKGDPYELPALYLLGAVTLVILGGGKLVVDRLWRGGR